MIVSEEQAAKYRHAIISEIEEDPGSRVKLEKGISLIAVVGRNMAGHSGICAAIFSILGKEGINVRMLAQATGGADRDYRHSGRRPRKSHRRPVRGALQGKAAVKRSARTVKKTMCVILAYTGTAPSARPVGALKRKRRKKRKDITWQSSALPAPWDGK